MHKSVLGFVLAVVVFATTAGSTLGQTATVKYCPVSPYTFSVSIENVSSCEGGNIQVIASVGGGAPFDATPWFNESITAPTLSGSGTDGTGPALCGLTVQFTTICWCDGHEQWRSSCSCTISCSC